VTNYNSGIPNAEYSYGVAKGRQGTNAMPAELDPAITSSRKPGLDPFTDYLVLELGEYTAHLKHRPARPCGRQWIDAGRCRPVVS
jgi:hypothetical protein